MKRRQGRPIRFNVEKGIASTEQTCYNSDMDYRRDEHRVHLIVYHLIWCPKRRRKAAVHHAGGVIKAAQKLRAFRPARCCKNRAKARCKLAKLHYRIA